jgi:hypothetical protein
VATPVAEHGIEDFVMLHYLVAESPTERAAMG